MYRAALVINLYQICVTVFPLATTIIGLILLVLLLALSAYRKVLRLSGFQYPDYRIEYAIELNGVLRRQMRLIRIGAQEQYLL